MAERTNSMIGTRIAQFRIVEILGRGGMGEVYRAEDTKLGREVALKLLPEEMSADPDRLDRFRREARTVAALNHPHIVTIHSVDEAVVPGRERPVQFLTMELVQGKTLDGLLPAGGFALDRLFELAIPIADALTSAHERRIVHRDLKPANVMVTDDGGRVKILDFGLAKESRAAAPSPDSQLPTQDALTQTGIIVGTPHYMSPEQACAEPVDHRSDIFSFGVMLFEMATGERPFTGESAVKLLSSVLKDPAPDPGRVRPDLPRHLGRIVGRCLEKAPSDRFQTMRDVYNELKALRAELSTAPAAGKPSAEKSIAVLPFVNMSPDPDQDYFCDGIAEEMINTLTRVRGLRIVPRSSAFRYKQVAADSREIGRQLDVTHLLEGSVRKAGDRLRITVQLIDVAADGHVWSQRYDRRLEDVFAIQEDIAQSTAEALQVALTAVETRALGESPTANVAAYDLYLRGRAFFYRGTRHDHRYAREMFSRAIEIDPTFTRAYAGLADTIGYVYKHFDADPALLDEADAASARALELDPKLPEAHTSRGVVHWLKGRGEEADRSFEQAIRVDPSHFDAHYLYGIACFTRGLHEKAAHLMQQASNVRPDDYQSLINLAGLLRGMGRRDEAGAAFDRGLAVIEKHVDLNPDDARAWYMGAAALIAQGKVDEGLGWATRAEAMDPENPLVFENLAGIYASAGRIERGLDCIEKAVRLGLRHRGTLENDPDLAPLRTHERFARLLESL